MEDLLQIEPVVTSEVASDPATSSDSNFIHANTEVISTHDLKKKCIIPVFSKDNESTISHPEFLEAVMFAAQSYFKRESFLQPAVRVSHAVKGRVPSAIGKPVVLLREDEKTIYYERMAFLVEVPSIRDIVNGNGVNLTLGGVRAYNLDNLNGKKSEETFKVFIGFKNKVCCNLCIWTDGFLQELKARSVTEIVHEAYSLFASYRPDVQLQAMTGFGEDYLTEHQFAQLVGRSRLYQFLPPKVKKEIPEAIPLMDSQVSTISKDYYSDKSFCRNPDGSIDLWKLYNLMTGSLKSSYIDTWLDRNVASASFVEGVQRSLQEGTTNWFLS